MPEMPIAPEEPAWPSSDEDYYRRVYVHRKDYGDLLQAVRDQNMVIESLVNCIKQLTSVVE